MCAQEISVSVFLRIGHRGGSSWLISGFGRSCFDDRDVFRVATPAAKSGEVEQETPKANGCQLGLQGRL